jgi:uncharacterized small protein (DUF1192 family)
MATMYCALCNRPVEAKRQIGAGTIILAVITGGLWLFTIPFYSKRCSICKSSAVSSAGELNMGQATTGLLRVSGLEQRLALTEGELDRTRDQLDRVRTERDFYRELLGDRAHTQ